MSSHNNRLSQRIPLHNRSETYRKGGVTFIRGKQARQMKRIRKKG